MTRPQRIRLSRARGFRLQAASRALNGLPAVIVARRRGSGGWGNPYAVGHTRHRAVNGQAVLVRDRAHAVELYREWIRSVIDGPGGDSVRAALAELRGHNLACWCPDSPCHADFLLEIANR